MLSGTLNRANRLGSSRITRDVEGQASLTSTATARVAAADHRTFVAGFVLFGDQTTMTLDASLPLEPLLWAEADEFELLQSEKHPGEAVDHLGVAAWVCLEHLRIQADCRREALCLLEALPRIISRRRKCERRDGHVVGQAFPPLLAVREGPLRQAMEEQKAYRPRAVAPESRDHRQSWPPKMLGEHV